MTSTPLAESAGLLGPPGTGWRVDHGRIALNRLHASPVLVDVPAEPAPLTLDLARCAVVVVDMQNDFCHPDGWLASIGVDIEPARTPIPVLAAALPALRSAGSPVVWLNWGTRPDRANLPPNVLHVYDPDATGTGIGSSVPTGHPVLQRDSWGAAIVAELRPAAADVMVHKHRMSGFWDSELDSVLRNLGVTTLLLGGVNADQCVLATLIDGACIGYDVVLLEDASATTSPAYCWDATLYNVRQCFGFTAALADIAAAARR